MTHDGRLKTSISNRHFGQEIERIRVEDLNLPANAAATKMRFPARLSGPT